MWNKPHFTTEKNTENNLLLSLSRFAGQNFYWYCLVLRVFTLAKVHPNCHWLLFGREQFLVFLGSSLRLPLFGKVSSNFLAVPPLAIQNSKYVAILYFVKSITRRTSMWSASMIIFWCMCWTCVISGMTWFLVTPMYRWPFLVSSMAPAAWMTRTTCVYHRRVGSSHRGKQ